MAITVTLPASGAYNVSDLFDSIDFIAFEGTLGRFTTTFFGLTGTYKGAPASASVNGSGFTPGMVNGDTYVVAGIIDLIEFSSSAGTIRFENVDIDMTELSPILIAEDTGSNPLGVETFLQSRAWDIRLGDADDIAAKNLTIGDGAKFNLKANDIVRGGGGNDNLFTGTGSDQLFGDDGNDKLDGGKGRDSIFGGNGNDNIIGGGGNDVIDPGAGKDIVKGGRGADDFIFGDDYGTNRIKSFAANSNREDIDLSAVSEITTFKDLVDNHMKQVRNKVVIDDDNGTKIIVLNTDIDDLGKGDFLF